MFAVFLAVMRTLLVVTLALALVVAGLLVAALVVVVLGELAGVHLIRLELALRLLALGRTRRLRRSGLFGLEVRVGHAEEGVEGGLDFTTAGHEDGLDDLGVDGGESFDQGVLGLLLRALRARRLGRRDVVALLLEGHARLRRGRALDGLVGRFVA